LVSFAGSFFFLFGRRDFRGEERRIGGGGERKQNRERE
jgi:hypothetical protein